MSRYVYRKTLRRILHHMRKQLRAEHDAGPARAWIAGMCWTRGFSGAASDRMHPDATAFQERNRRLLSRLQ